ncbi:hypothetical protein E2C01_019566 [Portunus trituberculatus]|uniref:Uncharacterized protein n=1 Tax=Portunus trituberculatus TaxID=210409 RepID=A0A5B7DZQ1_PORTR|nr:hypothetical protein [Portunus trituberculatus]
MPRCSRREGQDREMSLGPEDGHVAWGSGQAEAKRGHVGLGPDARHGNATATRRRSGDTHGGGGSATQRGTGSLLLTH